MTPKSLRAWRESMDWSRAKAARHLGISANGYAAYEDGAPLVDRATGKKRPRPIPISIAYSCACLKLHIPPEE
jgi:DNA-binding XRE family transcriptional regulator